MFRLPPERQALLSRLADQYGTPIYAYDAQIIRDQYALLKQCDVVRFAQKACSTTHILRLLRKAGAAVDLREFGRAGARHSRRLRER